MRKGFTIIESMLVFGILCILAAIIVVAIRGSSGESKKAKAPYIQCIEKARQGRCCIKGHEELSKNGNVRFICDDFQPYKQ